MDDLAPTDLKSVLHSKRANIYYLEHCRVLVNGGRVEYVTDAGKRSLYWNIPIANTTSVLLGTGTSITQAAMRELATEAPHFRLEAQKYESVQAEPVRALSVALRYAQGRQSCFASLSSGIEKQKRYWHALSGVSR